MGLRTLIVLTLLLAVGGVFPTVTRAAGSLEYRWWGGFVNGGTTTILRLEPQNTRWGLRVWGAWGEDNDQWWDGRQQVFCTNVRCFENAWAGVDLTYRYARTHQVYVGWERLSRSWAEDYVSTDGKGGRAWYEASHTGWRVGLMGTVPIRGRLSAVYDLAWVPQGRYHQEGSNYVSGPDEGRMFQLGLRYTLSPRAYIEAGTWDWGFTRPDGTFGRFKDHVWNGPYVSAGVTW